MNDPAARRGALTAWAACAIALAVGGDVAWLRLGSAVANERERIDTLVRATQSEVAQRATRAALRERVARDEAALDGLGRTTDRSSLVARFVRCAERTASAHHTTVFDLDERPGTMLMHPVSVAPTTAALPARTSIAEPVTLDVLVRGSYRDLLATIDALAVAPIPLRLELAGLERDDARSSSDVTLGALTARLHVTLVPPSAVSAVRTPASVAVGAFDARSH